MTLGQARPCPAAAHDYGESMSLSSVYLAEEALALPAAERETLARLLLASVAPDKRSDDEIRDELKSRLAKLKSGADPGLSFEEVFGESL